MAELILNVQTTPAFHALFEVAEAIALAHGEQRATEWAHSVINANPDLFVIVTTTQRPSLHLVQ